MTTYWINTVSREHVERAVAGGFTQADHGKPTRLRRLARGDRMAFYSPRTAMRSGEPLQQFTALGTVAADEPVQVEVTPDFQPWRLAMEFADVSPADIRPLLPRLGFIKDPQRWGMVFRRGLFEVPSADFALIEEALTSSAPSYQS